MYSLGPAGSPFLLYSCIVKFQAVHGPKVKERQTRERRNEKSRKSKEESWSDTDGLFSGKNRVNGFFCFVAISARHCASEIWDFFVETLFCFILCRNFSVFIYAGDTFNTGTTKASQNDQFVIF